MSDSVNHPSHYNAGKIEVIDAIRAKRKENELEGLKKAAWYLNRKIEELQNATK